MFICATTLGSKAALFVSMRTNRTLVSSRRRHMSPNRPWECSASIMPCRSRSKTPRSRSSSMQLTGFVLYVLMAA